MDIQCTQCGAKVPIEEESNFLRCPFCDTALYVETDRTVKHYYMSVQVGVSDLAPVVQRKLAYMEIKDPIQVKKSLLTWFPFWRLDAPSGRTVLIPAATPPVEDMHEARVPAGDLKLYSDELAAEHKVIEPDLLLEGAIKEARDLASDRNVEFQSASLMHLPVYGVEYVCHGATHRALVEAVSGEVYADHWPAGPQKEKDRVLGTIALAAFLLFFLEAAFIPGMGFVLLAYFVTAAGIYYFARSTLRKMGW